MVFSCPALGWTGKPLKTKQGAQLQGGSVSLEGESAALDFVALVDHEEELGPGFVFPLQSTVHAD